MSCVFALGAVENEVCICKLVTGELVAGKVDVDGGMIRDVALIVPREVKEEEKAKFGFYVIPYGFPMTQRISKEDLSLDHVIKVFPALNGFEDVISMYFKITQKELEDE